MLLPVALLVSGIGCVAIYLASENQLLLRDSWSKPLARAVGLTLLAAGLVLLLRVMQPVAGLSLFVVYLMLVFVALPYLGALRKVWRRGLR